MSKGNGRPARVGGINLGSKIPGEPNPDLLDWVERSQSKPRGRSTKQIKDRNRIRVKYDMPEELKVSIERAASTADVGTSASQFAAFLLGWAMNEYRRENTDLRKAMEEMREPAGKSLRFDFNLPIPDEWLD